MDSDETRHPSVPPGPPGQAEIGTVVDGRFEILELLGVGGMGTVFRARQLSVDRDVVLKLLRSEYAASEEAKKRFLREAQASSKLRSEHTITIFDFGQSSEGCLYIAMELLEGQALSERLERGSLPFAEVVAVVRQVARSLSEAHDRGIVHRDLKPDNIFLTRTPAGDLRVKVLDFGIAKVRDPDGRASKLTRVGSVIGTPHYMPPEQIRAQPLGPATDLYALALVVYECLTGTSPYEDTAPMEILARKISERLPPLDLAAVTQGLRAPLMGFFERALAADPRERFQSAVGFAETLAAILDDAHGATALVAPSSGRRVAVRDPLAATILQTQGAPASPGPRTTLGAGAAVQRRRAWLLPTAAAGVVVTVAVVLLTRGPEQGPSAAADSREPSTTNGSVAADAGGSFSEPPGRTGDAVASRPLVPDATPAPAEDAAEAPAEDAAGAPAEDAAEAPAADAGRAPAPDVVRDPGAIPHPGRPKPRRTRRRHRRPPEVRARPKAPPQASPSPGRKVFDDLDLK